jgi:hypothetical protein
MISANDCKVALLPCCASKATMLSFGTGGVA